tara:strand:+ start:571 stop:1023 length:453 start_codon:yes stop_codon:yes gene_type:complete
MINEILLYLLVFCFSMAVWLPIYKHVVSRWVQEATISRIESGDIDLNYLLDEGGVFDNLADRTVTLFKHHMLAEMGQLSRAAANDPDNVTDPVAMGLQASEDILKGLGMKKPPAILQYKMAQALSNMASGQNVNVSDFTNFDPSADFYKK